MGKQCSSDASISNFYVIRDADGRPRVKPSGEQQWSGEASRGGGLRAEEARVDVTIGDNAAIQTEARKEQPIWMVESTVISGASDEAVVEDALPGTSSLEQVCSFSQFCLQLISNRHVQQIALAAQNPDKNRGQDDITSMLLAHEKQAASKPAIPVDSSDDEVVPIRTVIPAAAAAIAGKSDYGNDFVFKTIALIAVC